MAGLAPSKASQILSHIKGTALDVSIVLRTKRCTIGELVKLTPGSVLMFDGPANNKGYLTINGQRLATGKIVQSAEMYALQVETVD